jgi:glycosyltransferase involved in cell wall biosynthesis
MPHMPDMLPVSVVIPAYQRSELLRNALMSVAGQEGPPPAEVIVIDDASSDDTGAVARESGARVVRHERNRGEGAARNTGLRESTQPWVALLDSDDEWLPNHLATAWPLTTGRILVGTACVARGPGPDADRVFGWPGRTARELRSPADVVFPENPVAPSAALVERATALSVGGFAEGLSRAADLDLWIRMLERGRGIASPQVTVIYRLHPGQVSGDREAMRTAQRELLGRYQGRPWLTRSTIASWEAVAAWDDRHLHGLAPLVGRLVNPRSLRGFAQMLGRRWRVRRASARFRATSAQLTGQTG